MHFHDIDFSCPRGHIFYVFVKNGNTFMHVTIKMVIKISQILHNTKF
jgi:hypothetical protein